MVASEVVATVRVHLFYPAGMPDPAGAWQSLATAIGILNPEWSSTGIQFTLDASPTVDPDLGSESAKTADCSTARVGIAGKKCQGLLPLFTCSVSVRAGGESQWPDNAGYVPSNGLNGSSHELGHYFSLHHVFQENHQFDESLFPMLRGPLSSLSAGSRQAYWDNFVKQYFTNQDDRMLGGTQDSVTDTLPSIQNGFRADLQDPPLAVADSCVTPYTGKLNIPINGRGTFTARFSPDRTSTMGYFGRCDPPKAVPGQFQLTAQQGIQARSYLDTVRLHLKGAALNWSAWFQVAGTTGKPLASTTFDNRLYLFASGNGTTTDIYANSALAQQPFGGWGAIGGQTDVAVGGTAFDSRLYLFSKGLGANHTIYFNFAFAQQPFFGWQAIGGQTDKTIAVTTFDSRIYLFAKGDGADHRIYLNNALAQQPFGGWVEVGGNGRTDEALAAVAFDGRLYVIAKNDGQNAYSLNSALPQQPFGTWSGIPSTLKSGVTPRGALAAASYDNRLFLVARGSDGRVYWNSALSQQPFGSWAEIPGDQTTDVSPTVTVFDNRLYMAIKLADKRMFAINASAL